MPQPARISARRIVATALEIIERDGEQALSMREVARRLQIAPNALYHYYRDREALENAVTVEGQRRLYARLARCPRAVPAQEYALSLAKVYLRFARSNWEVYSVMMKRRVRTDEQLRLDRKTRALLDDVLVSIAGAARVEQAASALWAMLHGMVMLERQVLRPEDRAAMEAGFALAALLEGMASLQSRNVDGGRGRGSARAGRSGRADADSGTKSAGSGGE